MNRNIVQWHIAKQNRKARSCTSDRGRARRKIQESDRGYR